MSGAHNTSIAASRKFGVRFPFQTKDVGDGYAAPGPVVTYRLSPEEVAARYGPPAGQGSGPACRFSAAGITHEELLDALRRGGCWTAAMEELGVGRARLQRLIELYEIRDNEWRGENVPPKREDLTKEKIESALRASRGNTKKAMAILKTGVGTFYKYIKEYGIDVASFKTPGTETGPREANTGAKAAPPDAPDGRAAEQASPATWVTQWEEPGPDTPDSRAKQEAPEKETAAPEPESAAENNVAGLTSDIFSSWTRVSPQKCVAAATGYVSVNAKGAVRFAASLANFQPGDRVEFYVSPDREQLAVRKVYGVRAEAEGYLLRQDTQSRAKICCSRQLKSLLLKSGVALPARYVGEWDERLQAWVGRR
jgi:hypothetical protein